MTDDFDGLLYRNPEPHSRWDTVALIVAALAAVFSAVTQASSHPVYAAIFLAIVAFAVASVSYRPVATWNRGRRLRDLRNRVAQKAWPDFLRFEKRFAGFLNTSDQRNLRVIINDLGGHSDEELFKLCPPNYLCTFAPILAQRNALEKYIGEKNFRRAVTEFVAMVDAYNTEYVLKPMKRLKESPRFTQLSPEARKYREEAIEDFRERWAGFLDDLTKFIDERNTDFKYELYHEAIPFHFERPKRLAR